MKIKIYQIDMDRDLHRVKFQGYEEMQKYQGSADIDESIYDRVFMGDVDCAGMEDVYRMFNTEGHQLHRGHSLSVSDIVEVEDGESAGFYFCDSIGFKKVPFHSEQTQKADNLIRILVVEPYRKPYESEIPNTLEGEQRAVQGRIEYIGNGDGTLLVINEENKLNGMEGNRRIDGDVVCGPFFVAGDTGDEICSLSDEQLAAYAERFAQPDEDITQEEIESHVGMSILTW